MLIIIGQNLELVLMIIGQENLEGGFRPVSTSEEALSQPAADDGEEAQDKEAEESERKCGCHLLHASGIAGVELLCRAELALKELPLRRLVRYNEAPRALSTAASAARLRAGAPRRPL